MIVPCLEHFLACNDRPFICIVPMGCNVVVVIL